MGFSFLLGCRRLQTMRISWINNQNNHNLAWAKPSVKRWDTNSITCGRVWEEKALIIKMAKKKSVDILMNCQRWGVGYPVSTENKYALTQNSFPQFLIRSLWELLKCCFLCPFNMSHSFIVYFESLPYFLVSQTVLGPFYVFHAPVLE